MDGKRKMNARNLILLTVLLGVVAGAPAAPILTVHTRYLAPNTPSQAIAISVSGVDMVTGFNLRAQIGDGMGTGAEPVFETIDFTGGIWDAYDTTVLGGVLAGNEQYAQSSVIFDNLGDAVAANGVVVTLLLDTTGFSGGSFDLLLSATDIGQDSDFVVFDGASLAPTITNGTIIVSDRLVPGDADGDLAVGVIDFGIFKEQFGLKDPSDTLSCNFNRDDMVDLEDFAILRSNFGIAPSPSGRFAPEPAPEPATLALLALGGLVLTRRSRHRKSK
jgi:hypothetical protein